MGKNTAKNYDVAKAAAVAALKDFREEERQRNRRTRYQNTELLLKNYLNLIDYFEIAKDRATDILSAEDLRELEELEIDEVIVKAILRGRVRTIIMVAQLEYALETLKLRMKSKGQPEKFEVIYCLYMDKARRDIERKELIKIVAEELHCGEASVYRWKNEMIRELSILLFGIDGLRLDV